MISTLGLVFIFIFTGASTADIFEADEVPLQNMEKKLRSAISGGIIPMDDDYRMPYHNGAPHVGLPHGINTNSYGNYPGSYYENQPYNYYRERSLWDWLQDVLSYCFGRNRNYGYHNGYNYRSENDLLEHPRGNIFGGSYRKRSTFNRRTEK